jgi:hypothetical protein
MAGAYYTTSSNHFIDDFYINSLSRFRWLPKAYVYCAPVFGTLD